MEEGEVGCGEEQQDDTEEEEGVKEADQGVEQKNEDIDDGDMRDIDAEVRSSSPPAVWAKKAV